MKSKIYLLFLVLVQSCPDSDQRCISCTNSKCNICFDSYLSPEGKCIKPSQIIENCLEYKMDGQCKYCKQGFYTTSTGKCVNIHIGNCLELQDNSHCSICDHGIVVSEGKCDSGEMCQTPKCDQCRLDKQGHEICSACEEGYAIKIEGSKFYCVSELGTTEHCLYLNSINPNQCAICDINYYWSMGICKESSAYSLQMFIELKHVLSLVLITLSIFV